MLLTLICNNFKNEYKSIINSNTNHYIILLQIYQKCQLADLSKTSTISNTFLFCSFFILFHYFCLHLTEVTFKKDITNVYFIIHLILDDRRKAAEEEPLMAFVAPNRFHCWAFFAFIKPLRTSVALVCTNCTGLIIRVIIHLHFQL